MELRLLRVCSDRFADTIQCLHVLSAESPAKHICVGSNVTLVGGSRDDPNRLLELPAVRCSSWVDEGDQHASVPASVAPPALRSVGTLRPRAGPDPWPGRVLAAHLLPVRRRRGGRAPSSMRLSRKYVPSMFRSEPYACVACWGELGSPRLDLVEHAPFPG